MTDGDLGMTQTELVRLGFRKPAKNSKVSDEAVQACYLSGMTPYKIGLQFGMTHQAIIYRLKQAGIYVAGGRKESK